jgi:hypothetical protein
MARAGLAARGMTYLLVGVFAAVAAFRVDQHPYGYIGALQKIMTRPFGGVMTVILAAGLACLAGWLALRGLTLARRASRRGGRDWLLAAGLLGDAAVYLGFVIAVLGLAFGWHSGNDEREMHSWVGWLLQQPAGRGVVAVAGVAVIGSGIGLIVWAWMRGPGTPAHLPPPERRWAEPVGRYGVTGRGAALIIVGFFLVAAAFEADPSRAHALSGILEHMRRTAYGWAVVLLFASAFGASAFFDFLEAIYSPPRRDPG